MCCCVVETTRTITLHWHTGSMTSAGWSTESRECWHGCTSSTPSTISRSPRSFSKKFCACTAASLPISRLSKTLIWWMTQFDQYHLILPDPTSHIHPIVRPGLRFSLVRSRSHCSKLRTRSWALAFNQNVGWSLSARGISFSFDDITIENFCQTNGVDLIIRAHQINSEMVRGGHKWHSNGRMVTIFSAANYLNMGNDSCVVRIDEKASLKTVLNQSVFSEKRRVLPAPSCKTLCKKLMKTDNKHSFFVVLFCFHSIRFVIHQREIS